MEILPPTVTLPVDREMPEFLLLFPVAEIETDPHETDPAPTAKNLFAPAALPLLIVIVPLTVKLFPAEILRVLAAFPPIKVRLEQTAAVFTLMVAVTPLGIFTASSAVGTCRRDQFVPVFQFAFVAPVHVF